MIGTTKTYFKLRPSRAKRFLPSKKNPDQDPTQLRPKDCLPFKKVNNIGVYQGLIADPRADTTLEKNQSDPSRYT